jgi:4-alpha-glucanotransferase
VADQLRTQANPSLFPRSSGILLHVTSLPGLDGIGDLGAGARDFVDWLAKAGQSLWQILPLGPTGFGDSPYQTLSAFAGNPLLISLSVLVEDGWLTAADLAERPEFSEERVDYGPVITWKARNLDLAWQRFGADEEANELFRIWCAQESEWLDDFGLFMALRDEHESRSWTQWETAFVKRAPAELDKARLRLKGTISKHQFRQWLFARQWQELRDYATVRGVRLLGDVPLFVAHDSCDVWANQDLFELDSNGDPTHVAGVPPDYFSETGQLWGNPLYRWQSRQAELLAWWIKRLQSSLSGVDLLRIDHFRGLESYWSIPATEKTAIGGNWVDGPGLAFFEGVAQALPSPLPLVAEDLGVITAEVEALREAAGLPGMKILQFAWDGPDNAFLPHNSGEHAVMYTGTHDNDPTVGWWRHLASKDVQQMVSEYVGYPVTEPHWTLIRLGMMSAAHTFVAPMQDVLGLGREGRMNLPGEGSGNWNWRLGSAGLENADAERLSKLTWLYNRSLTDGH